MDIKIESDSDREELRQIPKPQSPNSKKKAIRKSKIQQALDTSYDGSENPQFEEFKLLMSKLQTIYEESYGKICPVDPKKYHSIN